MKNDLEKIDNINYEMKLNDMVFRKMQLDLENSNELFTQKGHDDIKIQNRLFEKNYFFRRVLSVLSDNDIPVNACIGLFTLTDILPELFDHRDEFIGDSDSDSDIYGYVIEYGYRKLDELVSLDFDTILDKIVEAFKNYYNLFVMGGEEDDK